MSNFTEFIFTNTYDDSKVADPVLKTLVQKRVERMIVFIQGFKINQMSTHILQNDSRYKITLKIVAPTSV